MAAVAFSADSFAQRRLSLAERVAQLERQLGQSGGGSVVAGQQVDPELIADLLNRVELLQGEVQKLTALTEQQGNEIESLKQRQRAQFLDLDERMNRLRGGGASAIVTPSASPSRPAQPTQGGDSPSGTATTSAPVAEVSSDARTAYEDAFDLVRANKYTEAISAFNNFLGRHAASDYADNAQYWLGESYYASGNYPLALEAFQRLVANYPDSTKLADARLKIGFTYYGLEQWEEAESALNEVIETYEGSTAARLAENRLRVMRLQGRIR